jgi:site-specific recombinase XerD
MEAFLLQKRVGGCSARTLQVYRWWLERVAAEMPALDDLDSLGITTWLSQIRERVKPSTTHQAFRTLRTFVRWLVAMGVCKTNPMATIIVKVPKTLPCMPSEEELRAVLKVCPKTADGMRLRLQWRKVARGTGPIFPRHEEKG